MATLPELMTASNIFGRGFGEKRFTAILDEYPDILLSEDSDKKKLEDVKKVEGMAKKTSQQFVERINEFVLFMDDAGLRDKLDSYKQEEGETEHLLFGKKIVMTGFRDKELMEKLKTIGAEMSSSVSKNTFVVLVKDKDEDTGKADQARALNVRLMTPEEFKKMYKID